MSLALGDGYWEDKNNSVELYDVERFFNHFFGVSTDIPNQECNIIKSIFEPYLRERWCLRRTIDVTSPRVVGRGSEVFIHAEYKCNLDDEYEVSLKEVLCATSDGTYELSRKRACLETIFGLDVKSNEGLTNYICFELEKHNATLNPLFRLNNLKVRCKRIKKISTNSYEPIELLYEYSICADENGILYVEVKLKEDVIGTISIDEFIPSILNKELEKIFNCSFSSFQSTLTSRKVDI